MEAAVPEAGVGGLVAEDEHETYYYGEGGDLGGCQEGIQRGDDEVKWVRIQEVV